MLKFIQHFHERFLVRGGVYLRFAHVRTQGFDWLLAFEWALTIALLLAFLIRTPRRGHSPLMTWVRRFAGRKKLALVAVFVLSIGGRLALLTVEPFPVPTVQDELSYLLQADTFAHGRMTNPTPVDAEHFEAFHILLTPTYAGNYPPAAAVFLGFGQAVFRTPRAGQLILMALACVILCWMLQGLVPPEWALLGGVLAVVHISWFSYFGDTYWGGAIGVLGGSLLLGAAARMLATRRRPWVADGWVMLWLAVGLVVLANGRPLEGAVLALPLAVMFLKNPATRAALLSRKAAAAWVVLLGGLGLGQVYDYKVTHSLKLPEALYTEQRMLTPPMLFQKPNLDAKLPFKDLRDVEVDWNYAQFQTQHHVLGYLKTARDKAWREWLFWLAPALTPVFLLGLGPTLRSRRWRGLLVAMGAVCAVMLVETWVQPQYVSVGAGLIYLVMLNGLRRSTALRGRSRWAASVFPATVLAMVVMVIARVLVVPLDRWPYTWNSLGGQAVTYERVGDLLRTLPGKQLVLVTYSETNSVGQSWVNNGADLPNEKVLWARSISPESDLKLVCDYPGRSVWTVYVDEEDQRMDVDRTDPARQFDVSSLLKPAETLRAACGR